MMHDSEITILSLGKIARGYLDHSKTSSVSGITSNGLFLSLQDNRVIFLSFEPHQGPLTLNIRGNRSPFLQIEIGSRAYLSPSGILFPSNGLMLSTGQAELWQAPSLPGKVLSIAGRRAQLLSVIEHCNQLQPQGLLAALLPALSGEHGQPGSHLADDALRVRRLQVAWLSKQASPVFDALKAFMGRGAGLTPSGDDLVSGFLLACNRWGERLFPGLDMASLNQRVLEHASEATNAISYNLLACAAQAQADERLILALDGIVSGEPEAAKCSQALKAWGSSSGFDALAGMAIALF